MPRTRWHRVRSLLIAVIHKRLLRIYSICWQSSFSSLFGFYIGGLEGVPVTENAGDCMEIQKINYRAILYSIDYVTYRPANNET